MNKISNAEIRAALGYLGWKQKTLAEKSGLCKHTVSRALGSEKSDDPRRRETVKKMVETISGAGYEFQPRS